MATCEEYVPNRIKKEYGEFLIFILLKKDPTLTFKQARRILGYTYNKINSTDGKNIFQKIKSICEESDK